MCAAPGGKTCHIAALMGDQVLPLFQFREPHVKKQKERKKEKGFK